MFVKKYLLKKNISYYSGVINFRWCNLRPGLYIFNYHRVGDSFRSEYDSNVFSCNAENFSKHIEIIKNRFKIIKMAKLVDIIDRDEIIKEPLAMVTFDDGYIDNFEIAFPILKKLDMSAVFFIPTSYIGTNDIPWWDEIAWMVKKTKKGIVKLANWEAPVTISKTDINKSVRLVLNNIKKTDNDSMDRKLIQLREQLDYECKKEASEPLFLNWEQVCEMSEAGMDIGSHTHSHQILSHLAKEDQLSELAQSKEILERQIGTRVNSIAFPVGKPNTYTSTTLSLCEQAGYEVAFSFIHGYNPSPSLKRFELLRMPVDGDGDEVDLKYLTAFAPREWRK